VIFLERKSDLEGASGVGEEERGMNVEELA
jgi:hypothetical protein